MSVAYKGGFEKRRQIRKRFRVAEQGEVELGHLPVDWRRRFGALVPLDVLQGIAGQCGALDVRRRKVTCEVFFWAVVLALSKPEAVWLSTVASEVGIACVLAGLEAQRGGVSRQTISENLARRPWEFFAAVFKYLLNSCEASVAGPVAGLEVMQQLSILLVDSTVIRVAQELCNVFPTYPTLRSTEWAAMQAHARLALCNGFPDVLDLTSLQQDELDVCFLRESPSAVLYIFDLGYWCYALLDDIMNRQQHFVSRLKASCNPLIKTVLCGEQHWSGKRLKEIELTGTEVDLLVNLTCAKATANHRREPARSLAERRKFKGHRVTTYMQHDVRLVGHWNDQEQRWFLYATSLLDSQAYPAPLIADLYRLRWQIEIFFRNLKHVLGVHHFISHSENGIRIQLYAAMIHYVLTRLVVLRAAAETGYAAEDFSIPYCLAIVRHVLSNLTLPLIMQDPNADWKRVERILLAAVIAQGLRPNRYRPALLTSVKQRLLQTQVLLS